MDTPSSQNDQDQLDNGYIPDSLDRIGILLCDIFYYVSFLCCIIVFCGYAFIRKYDARSDRISLRLLIYATIAHIIIGIAGVVRTLKTVAHNKTACEFIMVLYATSTMFAVFIITCISVNLLNVFVHPTYHTKHIERWYVLTSFILGFILGILPILPKESGYGYNPRHNNCWYAADPVHVTSLWGLLAYYLWVCVSIFYCLIALILVLYKMRKNENIVNRHLNWRSRNKFDKYWCFHIFFRPVASNITIDDDDNSGSDETRRPPRVIHTSYVVKTARRVIWFPIGITITRIWSVINYLYSFRTGKINAFLMMMSYACVPLQGVFLLLVFLFDPSLHHAIRSFREQRKGNDHSFDTPRFTPHIKKDDLSLSVDFSLPVTTPSTVATSGFMSDSGQSSNTESLGERPASSRHPQFRESTTPRQQSLDHRHSRLLSSLGSLPILQEMEGGDLKPSDRVPFAPEDSDSAYVRL